MRREETENQRYRESLQQRNKESKSSIEGESVREVGERNLTKKKIRNKICEFARPRIATAINRVPPLPPPSCFH